LSAHYAKSHLRNIRKARDAGNIVKKNIPVEDVIFLAKEQAKFFSPVTDRDYKNFSGLFAFFSKKNMAVSYGIYSSQQQLISSSGWFFSHGRTYYILVGQISGNKKFLFIFIKSVLLLWSFIYGIKFKRV
jgi:hypothetical protein